VGERRGRALDAFATGLGCAHAIQTAGQHLVEHIADLAPTQAAGQIAGDAVEQAIRDLMAVPQGERLLVADPGPDGWPRILAPQSAGQRVGEGDAALQRTLAQGRMGVIAEQGPEIAGQAPEVDDQLAPQLAGLPPAGGAGAVAKTQEYRQRHAQQGKGRGAHVAQGLQLAALVEPDGDTGQQADEEDLGGNLGEDGTAQDEEQLQRAGARANDHSGGISGDGARGGSGGADYALPPNPPASGSRRPACDILAQGRSVNWPVRCSGRRLSVPWPR